MPAGRGQVVGREGDEAAASPASGLRANHLGDEAFDEGFGLDAEAVPGVVPEPGTTEEMWGNLALVEAPVDHEGVGEDPLQACQHAFSGSANHLS